MTDDVEPEDKRICWRCVGETFLKAKVKVQGKLDECDYCGKDGKTLSIGELAEDLEGAFERHFTRTPRGPSETEEFMYRESDLTWERPGEPSVYAIGAAAGLDDVPAEDLRAVLEANQVVHPDDSFEDDEGEFSEEAHYEERDADATELFNGWARFNRSLRTETRLFNSTAIAVLDSIFNGLADHATRAGRKIIVDAGPPRQKLASLYRARVFQSLEKLEEALKRPDLQLGPPPANLASAGRMNARGIAVFYGATHADVAIAEVRPPVGSHVLVGRFEIIRPLKLLDVEALRSIFVKGSIFDPTHAERLKKASFLADLSKQISLPVMPDDEPFEYLVTQAIADYLANLAEPAVDGLVYRSVQHGKGKNNVVLFHKAARVKPLDIPPKTHISAHAFSHDEDGPYPDFRVFEDVPAPEDKHDLEFDIPRRPPWDENREPALSIDTSAINVHHIERAAYTSEEFEVKRHRLHRSKDIKRVPGFL